MGGDGRHLAAQARTVAVARSAVVPARQAGARLQTVRGRLPGSRPDTAPVRRPPMACAGVPAGTRPEAVRQRVRVTGLAARHARPPETDPVRTAGPPRAASTGVAGPLRAASPGPAGPLPAASTAAAPGPPTTAGFGLRPVVRPAKAPAAGLHRAGRPVRGKEASAAPRSRVATSVVPAGQPTPGHGGPPLVTHGEAHGPRAARGGLLQPALMAAAGEIRTTRGRGPRVKGRPLVMAAVTGHRGQPAAGPAMPDQVTHA